MQLKPIEWLLMLLLTSSLYFHINTGGTGLRLPNNILIWSSAAIIGFYSLWRFSKQHTLYLPQHTLLLLAFPLLTLYGGMVSGIEIPQQWLFRLLYIWGGGLFLFSLFQYRLKQGRLDRLLLAVLAIAFIHAVVGMIQIFFVNDIPSWLPINSSGVPTGLFQQINNQASFQVTAILIALWLFSRPRIRRSSGWQFLIVLIMMAGAAFVAGYSGSRVAALGFLLALPLFIISRWRFIVQDKLRWLAISLVLVSALFGANQFENQRGLTSVLEKTTAMNAGFSGSARLGMYTIAFDVIKQAPFLGHGIGSFVRVWQFAKPDFYAEHPDAVLPPQRVSHPHNEVIFWLVEGGAIAGIGLAAFAFGVIITLIKLPHSRRYAYGAMLLPIALHTQVELPFYISSLHWFVFLFLLFVVLQASTQPYQLKLSIAAVKLIKLATIVGALAAFVFLSSSMMANLEFKRYQMKQVAKGSDPLAIALHHPYFKKFATEIMMISLFNSSVRYALDDNVRLFAEWAEQELKYNPNIAFYTLAVQANQYLKQDQHACIIAKKGLSLYPIDPRLKTAVEQCEK
ncbi:MAG: Wzy polymerase domain-containing protein [Gammaproteobacteria bacterium]|nr:Wzy polymerase domain-containing protein [Gammaproteobacteria bacterium]